MKKEKIQDQPHFWSVIHCPLCTKFFSPLHCKKPQFKQCSKFELTFFRLTASASLLLPRFLSNFYFTPHLTLSVKTIRPLRLVLCLVSKENLITLNHDHEVLMKKKKSRFKKDKKPHRCRYDKGGRFESEAE